MQTLDANKSLFQCFKTKLGWVIVCYGEQGIRRLSFGHKTSYDAQRYLESWANQFDVQLKQSRSKDDITERLVRFSEGEPDTFQDIAIELPKMTPFQLAVTNTCRSIPYGQKLTYGEVAEMCDSPRAARAVGNVMRNNPIPLIVPCHRVVGCNGGLGGFSSPQGTNMKQKLLDMEAQHI